MTSLISNMNHIWQIFVESNTFNFIIFVALFGLLFKKINLKKVFASLQSKIVDVIEQAKNIKADSEQELDKAEKSVENLEQELTGILKEAENSAEVIVAKIIEDGKKQVENIALNAEKIVKAEEKMLVSKLSHNTSIASIEVAKGHIKNVLKQTPSLHEKYIDESINEIDRLNF